MNAKRIHQKKPATSARHTNKALTGQVRIIGGQFKRQWVPFIDAEGLRPSPDRLRETLFNWIQFDLHDANVLDLCAGSGVLGFEALSRGANWVDFIELQPNQAKLILETAAKLKLNEDSYKVSIGDAHTIIPTLKATFLETMLKATINIALNSDSEIVDPELKKSTDSDSNQNQPSYQSNKQFSYQIVFVDPPYDLKLWVPMLKSLIEQNLVNSETLFYIEDKKQLQQTLSALTNPYRVLKETKVGQVFASLIQIEV